MEDWNGTLQLVALLLFAAAVAQEEALPPDSLDPVCLRRFEAKEEE